MRIVEDNGTRPWSRPPEILAHIERRQRERPDWGTRELLAELEHGFGLTVHRRSLERVLRGKKIAAVMGVPCVPRDITDYEELRSAALLIGRRPGSGWLPFGLAAWRTAAPATPPQRRASEPSWPAAEAPRHGSLPAAFAAIVLRLTRRPLMRDPRVASHHLSRLLTSTTGNRRRARSARTARARDGFQAMVAAVGLGKVGIVLGLEVSRLARNSVYDPAGFNDRLLLGLKRTVI
ncbi:helix-turn-helix domain-containing protein [Mesorhizobium amorphae]|uniref:helix-turn-helix domain-containing protein n=1 Tax=Mesorhizobium amorphae TaxID=71433 RepID=UPI00080A9D77|nr:hypothetical protein [Mesorhizobium amorphae]ANT54508.1 hypothetical protein A6B35_31245 [Mesorhizobium amorphae CCNWGS0123]